MAISNEVSAAVRGAAFYGTKDKIIDKAQLANLTTTIPSIGAGDTLFTNLGHMSVDTLPEFAKDGGDPTNLSTWNTANFSVTYSDTTLTITLHAVQSDRESLKLFYNATERAAGGLQVNVNPAAQELSLLLFYLDSNRNQKLGLLFPNVSLKYDTPISASTDSFNTFDLIATVKSSDALANTATNMNDHFVVFTNDDFAVAA